MLRPVHLNDEAGLLAEEIGTEGTDPGLMAELEPLQPTVAEMRPESLLGRRLVTAQLPHPRQRFGPVDLPHVRALTLPPLRGGSLPLPERERG
jgi:hypothetical protein